MFPIPSMSLQLSEQREVKSGPLDQMGSWGASNGAWSVNVGGSGTSYQGAAATSTPGVNLPICWIACGLVIFLLWRR